MKPGEKKELSSNSEEEEKDTTVPRSLLLISNSLKKTSESASVIARESISQTRHLRRIDNLVYLVTIGSSVIMFALLVGVVYLLKDLLALLVISFLVAYIFSPIVTYFERQGVNRTLVIIIISLMILGGIVLTSIYLLDWMYGQILGAKDMLLGPSLFQSGDFKDLPGLVAKLRRAKDPLSQYLRGQFSPETRQLLDNYKVSQPPSEALQKSLVNELNQLLEEDSLYNESRFSQVGLSEKTRKRIKQHPKGETLIRLNRLLLEKAYSDEIGKSQLLIKKSIQDAEEWIIKWNEKLESRIPMLKDYNLVDKITEIELNVQDKIMPAIQELFSSSQKVIPSIFSAITIIGLIPFLTFFMLNSGRNMKRTFVNLVPNSIFEPTLLLLDELDKQLGQYIRSRMIIETIVLSILTSISYWILGLKFFFILGIFAGIANLIPYAGPFIGAIPALIVAFVGTHFGLIWTIILIVLLSFAIQFVDNAIIFPLFVGKSVDLGPISTMFAVLIGTKLLGLLGLLMAVPIAAMLKVIISEMFKQFRGYMQA